MIYKYQVMENGKLIEKEMVIEFQSLNEDVKTFIDRKIAEKGIDLKKLDRLEDDLQKLKRQYTFNSLKLILGEQLRR